MPINVQPAGSRPVPQMGYAQRRRAPRDDSESFGDVAASIDFNQILQMLFGGMMQTRAEEGATKRTSMRIEADKSIADADRQAQTFSMMLPLWAERQETQTRLMGEVDAMMGSLLAGTLSKEQQMLFDAERGRAVELVKANNVAAANIMSLGVQMGGAEDRAKAASDREKRLLDAVNAIHSDARKEARAGQASVADDSVAVAIQRLDRNGELGRLREKVGFMEGVERGPTAAWGRAFGPSEGETSAAKTALTDALWGAFPPRAQEVLKEIAAGNVNINDMTTKFKGPKGFGEKGFWNTYESMNLTIGKLVERRDALGEDATSGQRDAIDYVIDQAARVRAQMRKFPASTMGDRVIAEHEAHVEMSMTPTGQDPQFFGNLPKARAVIYNNLANDEELRGILYDTLAKKDPRFNDPSTRKLFDGHLERALGSIAPAELGAAIDAGQTTHKRVSTREFAGVEGQFSKELVERYRLENKIQLFSGIADRIQRLQVLEKGDAKMFGSTAAGVSEEIDRLRALNVDPLPAGAEDYQILQSMFGPGVGKDFDITSQWDRSRLLAFWRDEKKSLEDLTPLSGRLTEAAEKATRESDAMTTRRMAASMGAKAEGAQGELDKVLYGPGFSRTASKYKTEIKYTLDPEKDGPPTTEVPQGPPDQPRGADQAPGMGGEGLYTGEMPPGPRGPPALTETFNGGG